VGGYDRNDTGKQHHYAHSDSGRGGDGDDDDALFTTGGGGKSSKCECSLDSTFAVWIWGGWILIVFVFSPLFHSI
jgi:hypothetical protein